ncbi:MAG: T9SS type A sorting domain-containing protein, partial [Bacteroidales bacterium]
ACDKYGNAYITGNFFGPENALDGIDLTQPGDSGIFIARYSHVRTLSGTVYDNENDPAPGGYVRIYGYTLYQRSPLNDSVQPGMDGHYVFQDIPFGHYILSAVPGEEFSENYMTTYYPSYEYWEFTDRIVVDPTSTTEGLDIHLQSVEHFEGRTEVGGQVSEEEESDLKSTSFEKAKPSKKASVILAGQKSYTKSTYEVVAVVETDDDGNFAFYGIEDGGYYVWVDIPGLPVEEAYFIEVIGHQYVSSLDYLITEEQVVASGLPVYSGIDDVLPEDADVLVYPNPAVNDLTIEIRKSGVGVFDLYDANGRLLAHDRLKSGTRLLDVSGFPAGNYIIRIITDKSIVVRKLNFIR